MRWEDERYVRVYTRDTPEWSALSWEARAVFWGLLRRCDRAGILQVGKAGLRALAGVIPAPLEVVERAVPELLADGCLRAVDGAYVVPNYLAAQEAHVSDAQRKRDQRERDRARMMAAGIVGSPDALAKFAAIQRESVTPADKESRPEVTHGHTESRAVTESHSVPCRAVPDRADQLPLAGEPPPAAGKVELENAAARELREAWNELTPPVLARWRESAGRNKVAAEALKRRPLEQWREVFARIGRCPRLHVGIGEAGWKANPDWAIRKPGVKAEPAQQVLEGAWDGPVAAQTGQRRPTGAATAADTDWSGYTGPEVSGT